MSQPLLPISRKNCIAFACFLVLYEFLAYIANDMIMPGMISVVHSFNAPESTIATSLTFFVLGGASLQLILGPLSDAYGRRSLMLLGVCSFFIFTLFIASASSMNQFLAARFLQGMGLCFIGVIGYATVQEIFEEKDAIRIIATMANATVFAPLLGPLLGAIVIHYYSWRYVFYINASLVLIALWGLWQFMPESVGKMKNDGKIIPKTPFSLKQIFLNYKHLVMNSTFIYCSIALAIMSVPFVAWIALAPIILISEGKLTVIQYGLYQLPLFGATILSNVCLRRLIGCYSLQQIIFFGCIIMLIGIFAILLLPYYYGNHYRFLYPGLFIIFFALSMIGAPLTRFCLFATPVSKGTASAIISLNTMIIGAFGIEMSNFFYKEHNNFHFSIFCSLSSVLFLLFIVMAFYSKNTNNAKSTIIPQQLGALE